MFKKLLFVLLSLVLFSAVVLPNFSHANEMESDENIFVDEFVDEDGNNNKMIIEMKEDRNIVSLYVNGILEQQSVAYKSTGELVGFSQFGEKEFRKNVIELVNVDNSVGTITEVSQTYNKDVIVPVTVTPDVVTDDVMSDTITPDVVTDEVITPMGYGYYSQVATRKSVPSSLCSKVVTAYLYQKSTTQYSKKIILSLSKGEVLTAIVASIVTAVILKTPITVTLLKELLVGVGVSIAAGALSTGFKGSYQVRSEIQDYYASISGTKYFTNKITKEYFSLYNQYNGKKSTRYLGQHVSAYGKPTTHQVMLSQAIVNWANATKCK